jgi:predicted RNA-binding protein with PUA-like domain
MQAMQPDELALFSHSSTEARGVVGLMRVVKLAYPDESQFDPKSQYYDKGAKREAPRWFMVDVEFVEKFERPFGHDEMKADKRLNDMLVVRRGMRLSVQPVEPKHMRRVLAHCQSHASL